MDATGEFGICFMQYLVLHMPAKQPMSFPIMVLQVGWLLELLHAYALILPFENDPTWCNYHLVK